MFEIKHKPHRVEEALKQASASYSKDMCQVLSGMPSVGHNKALRRFPFIFETFPDDAPRVQPSGPHSLAYPFASLSLPLPRPSA